MLTPTEQECLRHFFDEFSEDDLLAVALAISKHLLRPSTRKDALDIICQHSDCIEMVLEKRKITKTYLCKYLHENKVSISFSADKHALIRKILDFWNIKKSKPLNHDDDENTLPTETDDENSCNVTNDVSSVQSISSDNYYYQLAFKFSEWYYALLNDQDVLKIDPEHFFVDSQMKVVLENENNTDIVEANSSMSIVETLRDVKLKYNLKFLPNLSYNSIKVDADIHGQVMIMVCGTLHSNVNQVVGLFEQVFLLIRDISANENWKIKRSQIILRNINPAIQSSDGLKENHAVETCV